MIINGTDIYMTRGDGESVTVSCPERPFEPGDKVDLTIQRYAGSVGGRDAVEYIGGITRRRRRSP